MTNRRIDTSESGSAETDSTEPETEGSADVPVEDSADVPVEDSAGPETEDSVDVREGDAPTDAKSPRRRRSISVGVRTLVIGVVIAMLAGTAVTFAWLYIDAGRRLDAQARESAAHARAEKIALDYAVNAATMDFKDLQAWKVRLVAGTSEKLNHKLTEAAKSMEQILVPLQWSSTAKPLVAKVRSGTGGILVVDCFVSVQTKTVQAPEALQSTATYSITIDSNQDWQITDVGGIGSMVGPR